MEPSNPETEAPKSTLQKNQDWFKALNARVPTIKVVPPPPPGKPEIKGWVIHCKWCINERTYLDQASYRNNVVPNCRQCGGRGLIFITGG